MEDQLTQVVNDTWYHRDTPAELVALLERCRTTTHQRIRLIYGDVATGKAWGEDSRDAGTIGRSMGTKKIPLLVRTSRSMGGEAILTHCIVKVLESRGSSVLYEVKP